MFKHSVVTRDELVKVSDNISKLNMTQVCNQNLVKQIRLALPTCQPFSMASCVIDNSEYRLWCAVRADVLTQCKELENG